MGTDPGLVAHLYRRAGFGAAPSQIEALSAHSWTDLVGSLVAGLSEPDPGGDAVKPPHLTTLPESAVPGYHYNSWTEYTELVSWWAQRMVATSTPLREKLVLLLHCQFPTSWVKVGWAYMMYVQNQIFRRLGPGSFEALTQAVAKDPAMLIWLDTATSHRDAPNQNFARELMERFTMGAGNYSQRDVVEASRCFTGWSLDDHTGLFYFNPYDNDNGVKTFLGRTGRFSGEDIITIVTSTPASHHWVTARIFSWLAFPVSPGDPVVSALVPAYSKRLSMTDLLEAILHHPAFVSTAARQGLVKQPIEYLVGALRNLGLTTAPFSSGQLQWLLQGLGQVPFTPPSVGGWGANEYWQSTGASAGYLQLAGVLAGMADLTAIEDNDGHPSDQVEAVLKLVGLPQVSARTRAALTSLAVTNKGGTGSWPAQQLVALALVCPEYGVN